MCFTIILKNLFEFKFKWNLSNLFPPFRKSHNLASMDTDNTTNSAISLTPPAMPLPPQDPPPSAMPAHGRILYVRRSAQETHHTDHTADTCGQSDRPKTSAFQAENTCSAPETRPKARVRPEIRPEASLSVRHEIHAEANAGLSHSQAKAAATQESLHQWSVQTTDRQAGRYVGARILHQ